VKMRQVTIKNISNKLPVNVQAAYCETFICRTKGLMFRKNLPVEKGLLLVNKNENKLDAAIHMLFVFTDLTIVWINSEMIVVDTVLAKGWGLMYIPQKPAKYTLELNPKLIESFKIGDVIEFE